MFEKMQIKRKIRLCKKRIELLEKKRSRSQAALVDAILTDSVPDDVDVDYFNQFTAQITNERERIHKYQNELESLESK